MRVFSAMKIVGFAYIFEETGHDWCSTRRAIFVRVVHDLNHGKIANINILILYVSNYLRPVETMELITKHAALFRLVYSHSHFISVFDGGGMIKSHYNSQNYDSEFVLCKNILYAWGFLICIEVCVGCSSPGCKLSYFIWTVTYRAKLYRIFCGHYRELRRLSVTLTFCHLASFSYPVHLSH